MHAASIGRALFALSLVTHGAACDPADPNSAAMTSIVVDVIPSTATLGQGDRLQLTASVTGTSVTIVTWSVDCGSISDSGLYTAPDTVGACRVVATSQADASKSGSATVTVTGASTPGTGWGATCAAEPLRQTGTTYYFCDCQAGADANCAAGNDANPGTSPAVPKRTWPAAVAAFNGLSAGGTVALCKGGRWTATSDQTLNNAACAPDPSCPLGTRTGLSCTPSTTCDLRDYQAPWGGTSKPVISGGSTLWTGGSSVSAADGFRVLNLKFVGAGDLFAFCPSTYASDYEMCNIEWDNFGGAVYMELPDTAA
jgi:hypothetical protein